MDANEVVMLHHDPTKPLAVVGHDRIGAYAKCPECGSPALNRESLTLVSCRHCGAWSRP